MRTGSKKKNSPNWVNGTFNWKTTGHWTLLFVQREAPWFPWSLGTLRCVFCHLVRVSIHPSDCSTQIIWYVTFLKSRNISLSFLTVCKNLMNSNEVLKSVAFLLTLLRILTCGQFCTIVFGIQAFPSFLSPTVSQAHPKQNNGTPLLGKASWTWKGNKNGAEPGFLGEYVHFTAVSYTELKIYISNNFPEPTQFAGWSQASAGLDCPIFSVVSSLDYLSVSLSFSTSSDTTSFRGTPIWLISSAASSKGSLMA